MSGDAIVKSEALERAIQDAATMPLDACLAAIPADEVYPEPGAHEPAGPAVDIAWRQAQVMSLAVQAVAMADLIDAGSRAERRVAAIGRDVLLSRAYGIGLGMGHLTASVDTLEHAADFVRATVAGYENAVDARMGDDE